MENLWVKIARRYKNRACIAVYDIMNEPLNNADERHNVQKPYRLSPWEDTNEGVRVKVYDRMIKAIRKVDPNHIITVEGIWRLQFLPNPYDYGWTNVMYQLHSYDADKVTVQSIIDDLDMHRNQFKTAGYMGEFNPVVYYHDIVTLMNEKNISYTLWNYKTGVLSGDYNGWGLFYRTYSDDIFDICGKNKNLAEKIMNGYDGTSKSYTLAKSELSADEIKELYTKWWTPEFLSTQSFVQNRTLKSYLK